MRKGGTPDIFSSGYATQRTITIWQTGNLKLGEKEDEN